MGRSLLPQTAQVRSSRLNLNPQRRQANDFSSEAKAKSRAHFTKRCACIQQLFLVFDAIG